MVSRALGLLPLSPFLGVRELNTANSHEAQGVIFKHFPAALPALDSAGLDLGIQLDMLLIQVQNGHICARMVDAVQLVFLDFFFFLSEGGAVSFAFGQSVSGF